MKVQTDASQYQKSCKAIYDLTQICKTFILAKQQQTFYRQISSKYFLLSDTTV